MGDQYEREKESAAREAVKYVKDGMMLGVGSGSTVKYFIEELARRTGEGLSVIAVPTSRETARLCEEAGIPLYQGCAAPTVINLTVDGADEFDGGLNLIKGGGGDLLWEKIIASASEREIIIADSRKQVAVLGESFPLPVEVIPYAADIVKAKLTARGISCEMRLAADKIPFITDEGNQILDCKTGGIRDLGQFAQYLDSMTGVAEHGIFMELADMVIMGNGEGVECFYAGSEIVTPQAQSKTMEMIFKKIVDSRKLGQTPVVELDLDLTTFVPQVRAIEGLKAAGQRFGIMEFLNPVFDLLPGYTREAWTNFISRNQLPGKYPELLWLGNKDGDENVYSVFHTRFWDTELLSSDTLTVGLKGFTEKVHSLGGITVLVSGRWKEEQIAPTFEVLKKQHLEGIPLMIGNPKHDGEDAVSDSQIKAFHQPEIREKYGVPTVIVDDRKENRDAVLGANPGIEMLSVGISIPGFTYDEETTGEEWKLSTWL